MEGLIRLVLALIQVYTLILLVRIIMSWINVDRGHPLVQVLHQVTEPVLEPVRRALPPLGMIDLSPIIVFVVLRLLQGFLLGMVDDF